MLTDTHIDHVMSLVHKYQELTPFGLALAGMTIIDKIDRILTNEDAVIKNFISNMLTCYWMEATQ